MNWTIVLLFVYCLKLFCFVCNMCNLYLENSHLWRLFICWCIPEGTVSCYPFSLSLAASVAFFACLIMLATKANDADICGRSSPKKQRSNFVVFCCFSDSPSYDLIKFNHPLTHSLYHFPSLLLPQPTLHSPPSHNL